ncbi:MAG TPA: DUF2811 domain-containing protein [Leptolyngbyaceae cyanobacterium M33_DOE_097]|uniref:DUF2811 domain-containing protein n=1 Tax=Oscillatoriales cyanobacterium SpSt-418 TaxID=2282169 RepID=A0A7C3PIC5_9CYAN|nr:DUF2811 domain-containing protein [Leptolyngbyaceae cyanobacterium M33_DOE_097]
MNTSISLQVEIPEILHEALKSYLELRPDWDQDRVFTASLSLFLLQNRSGDSALEGAFQRQASRIYLDTLFKHPVGQSS